MFLWILILVLLALGWHLGQPELKSLFKRLSRKQKWVGALHPAPAAVTLYEDRADLVRFQEVTHLPAKRIKHLEESHRLVSQHLRCSPPQFDFRLTLVAQWLGEALARGVKTPQASIVRALSSHFGVSAPIPIILSHRQSLIESHEGFLGRYHEQLVRALSLGSPQLAIGYAELHVDDELICVAVFQPRFIKVNPFSRRLLGDMGLVISGETLEMMPLEAWITSPNGSVQQAELERNGSFYSLKLSDRERGLYQVELVAECGHGPVICLNVPLYRSVMPPKELILTQSPPPSRWGWRNRRRLYQLVNESRERIGSPRLPMSKELNSIAQEYAVQMANLSFVAHTSPTGERLDHRSSRLENRAERILENLAVGATVDEVHDQLMSSPTHRAAILDTEVTHIGIGISVSEGLVYGVQVFSLMNRRLRLSEDRAEVYRIIQQQRRGEGLVRLPHDSQLERVALEIARALVSGECKSQEVNQHAHHLLDKGKDRSNSNKHPHPRAPEQLGFIEVHICQVNRAELLPKSDHWLQEQVKSFGVGLAQGDANEPYWVVSVLRLQDRGQRNTLTGTR